MRETLGVAKVEWLFRLTFKPPTMGSEHFTVRLRGWYILRHEGLFERLEPGG